MTWNKQTKNTSSFVNQVKNFLINFLLWTDDDAEPMGRLLYTTSSGDTGRIILEDHSFQNQTKHTN